MIRLFAILLVALVLAAPIAARAEPVAASTITVTDGDTIRLRGQARSVRLVGLDAPELWHPRCAAEASLAETARDRLAELIREGPLDLDLVACSCPPGTEGTARCNHGRRCGVLRAGGRDVAQILVAEGLAAPLACGPTHCPRKADPWCAPGRP